jgi:hypothetical protein
MAEGLPVDPGLCGSCRHASIKGTRRGTTYLRCTRAEWDSRLVRYPPLPVLTCVGYDPPGPADAEVPPAGAPTGEEH